MSDCLFCEIVKKEIPADILYENEACLAILDIMPANKGHILILSKNHYESLVDMPAEEFVVLMSAVYLIVKAMNRTIDLETFNLLQNNGKVAGQVIPHFHFHILPRKKEDSVSIKWDPVTYDSDEEKEQYLDLLKKGLNQN